jgi:predicted transcriptional regulator/RimJ/RimL family protein N-acetyltransferase
VRARSIKRRTATFSGARAILLSIQPEHAERIFQGTKRYELRKVLPAHGFSRVFLYKTGGNGIVGCFDVGRVLKKTIGQLWESVGNAATTHGRFREYFKPAKWGYAIEIKNPLRFDEPVPLDSARGPFGYLAPPQSFMELEPGDPLYSTLECQRAYAVQRNPPYVRLRRISDENRDTYLNLVVRHISPNYQEIDERFPASTLKIHDLGYDPTGFFTVRKEVLEICNHRGSVIGFTTLTYKSGGCVKTGPTILLKRFRSKGYGQATRMAIEERARQAKVRKVYSTCPDRSERVARYLLASGMRVEAHLERHYAATHDELVFGKLLVADEPPSAEARLPAPNLRANLYDPTSLDRRTLVADFANLFKATWSPVSLKFARAIVAQALDSKTTDKTAKPKRLVCLQHGDRCVAAIVLLPKRGGAVKALLLRGTRNASGLHTLLSEASSLASDLGGRKLYFIHPLVDSTALAIFRSAGFQTEGLLRAPYHPGQDAVVISRFL